MNIEDRLSKIEQQINELTTLVCRAVKPNDIVVATSTYLYNQTYLWCSIVKCPDKDQLIQTGVILINKDDWRYIQKKAQLIAAWAGLQTAIHLPGSTQKIHFITDSPLEEYLKEQTQVQWTNLDLLDRYHKLLNIYTTDKISDELITQQQHDQYINECHQVLSELIDIMKEEEKKCLQSVESESSQETSK